MPMLVTLDGTVTDVSPLQSRKAKSPMLVTRDGIVTDVSPLQPENASASMLITPFGITTHPLPDPRISVIPSFERRQLSIDLYFVLSTSTTIVVSPLHQLNAELPIFVTLEEIVTDVSPSQAENAKFPMRVTPNGIVTDVSLVQP